MSLPGWYPDPTGDWESRFWDGRVWTPAVANGPYVAEAPVEVGAALPETESMIWSDGTHHFSTHRVWINNGSLPADRAEFPLWAVARVEVRAHGDPATATGTVTVVISYAGYTDRTHWVMKRVANAHPVGAMLRLWANRNRRQYLQPTS